MLPDSPEFPTVTGTPTLEQVHGIKSPFSRELSYNVRAVDESILDEDRRMRRLRLLVDLTEAALMQSDLSLGESLQLMENTRRAALSLFPDKGSVYDLIYPRRFGRILAQRFPGLSS